jgi:hypothetical protein
VQAGEAADEARGDRPVPVDAHAVQRPGADGRAWYWHRVIPELRSHGHEAVAVEAFAAGPPGGPSDLLFSQPPPLS